VKTALALLGALCLLGAAALFLVDREEARWSRLAASLRPFAAHRRTLRDRGEAAGGARPAAHGIGTAGPRARSASEQARAWLAGDAGRELSSRVAREHLLDAIGLQYGPLLRRLKLDPDAAARFESLIAEERTTAVDAIQVAQADGIRSGAGYLAAIREAVAEVDGQVQSLLGADDYQAFIAYRQELPEEQTVAKLGRLLAGSPAPLADGQQEQLVQLIAQMEPPSYRENEDILGIIGLAEAPLTPPIVAAAGSALAPPQAAALQSLYDEQRARVAALLLLRREAGRP
jgi:hypothetical protein